MGRERFFGMLEKESGLWRGELWIAEEVLKGLGLARSQHSLIDLAAGLEADICFFSYSSPIRAVAVDSGEMAELIEKGHGLGLACGVAVDGPFERLVGQMGFMEVMGLFANGNALKEALQKNVLAAEKELAAAAGAGADLLVLCDDIAYNRGLYFSPGHYNAFILPLYRRLRGAVSAGAPLGFHSDGNIESIMAGFYNEGYSLFSVEPEAMNLIDLSSRLPGDVVIIAGIKADWLVGPDFGQRETGEIKDYISTLARGRRIILSSACGIPHLPALERLKGIYRLLAG